MVTGPITATARLLALEVGAASARRDGRGPQAGRAGRRRGPNPRNRSKRANGCLAAIGPFSSVSWLKSPRVRAASTRLESRRSARFRGRNRHETDQNTLAVAWRPPARSDRPRGCGRSPISRPSPTSTGITSRGRERTLGTSGARTSNSHACNGAGMIRVVDQATLTRVNCGRRRCS